MDALQVLAEGVRVHRHLRMSVRTEEPLTLHANGLVAERGAFRGTSHDTDVKAHLYPDNSDIRVSA